MNKKTIYYTKEGRFEIDRPGDVPFNDLYRNDGGPTVIWTDERKDWHKDGNLHREDGPAVLWKNGNMVWYLNGKSVHPIVWMKENGIDPMSMTPDFAVAFKLKFS